MDIPIWKDPENVAFLKDILKYLLIAGIVAYPLLKVIQPSLKTMFPPPRATKTGAGEASSGGLFGSRGTVGSGRRRGRATVHIDHYASRSRKNATWRPRTRRRVIANMIKDWMGANAQPEEGLEKSAILLIALGEDHAAGGAQAPRPARGAKIGHAMAAPEIVPRAKVEKYLDEFPQDGEEHSGPRRYRQLHPFGADQGARRRQGVQPDFAHPAGGETSGIEGLKWMDAADRCRPDPQRAPADHRHDSRASGARPRQRILNHFTERLRNDVVLRIATLEASSPPRCVS